MRPAALFPIAVTALAASALHFDIDILDERGKHPSGVTIEEGPEANGWYELKASARSGDPVLIWPFDAKANAPDGPSPLRAVVIQRGLRRALSNPRVVGMLAVPVALGISPVSEVASRTGFNPDALQKALEQLNSSTDPFEKGTGLLLQSKYAEAAEELGKALKDTQRQLTRVPAEIYTAAVLEGVALDKAAKYDESAVAFLLALRQRADDPFATAGRRQALIKAGKPEAAESLK